MTEAELAGLGGDGGGSVHDGIPKRIRESASVVTQVHENFNNKKWRRAITSAATEVGA